MKHQIYGVWFGGNGYALPSEERDIEEFTSIQQIKDKLEDRYHNRCYGEPDTPCVDRDTTEFWVFFGERPNVGDMYPDRIVKFGPRGGIRVERC